VVPIRNDRLLPNPHRFTRRVRPAILSDARKDLPSRQHCSSGSMSISCRRKAGMVNTVALLIRIL
jgi:hypothetical protein